jgi:hypothetical protein
MDDQQTAEKFNYWDTTVHPARSQAEIIELLENFGTQNYQVWQGQTGGQFAWLIRFEWRGQSYRFAFTPLPCEDPDKARRFGSKSRSHAEQAKWQMGRVAVHFVKAILTAAETQPAAMFGFLELPGVSSHPGGLPKTTAELDVEELTGTLPELAVGSKTGILRLTEEVK